MASEFHSPRASRETPRRKLPSWETACLPPTRSRYAPKIEARHARSGIVAAPVDEAQVQALWADLVKNPKVHWPETPLLGAFEIFSDAVKAFGANAIHGAAILCRAAIDGACLVFLIYSKSERAANEWLIHFPLGLDGKMRDVPWSELRGGMIESGLFSSVELRDIDQVRERGNAAAHLMEKHLKWIHAAVRGRGAQGDMPTNPWGLPMDTWRDLQHTRRVIERLGVAIYEDRKNVESARPGEGGREGQATQSTA